MGPERVSGAVKELACGLSGGGLRPGFYAAKHSSLRSLVMPGQGLELSQTRGSECVVLGVEARSMSPPY